MGVHTIIYRERDLRPDGWDKYSIRFYKGKKEIKLTNAVSIREEFYFGKSVWAINEWLYRHFLKEYGKSADEDMCYEWIDDDYIYTKDLEKLLNKIKRVLKNPERAEEILPYPKDLRLSRPKKGTYKETKHGYIIDKNTKWDDVPREEMYGEGYFEDLKWAEQLLEQLIKEDKNNDTGIFYDYIISVG